ncbi:YmfL family putative regulatory protein [Kingella negevensis]|uniref:YmfL family putative regulatory protein n=1 Tax=Kingella negevensis TaxID=1522312 RepID=UPI002550D894|nr:YmfL family putative regulatory protein [Kingella negevensis]MDK4710811.1 YmfL family putative regulatory protein [Kingella negevensis]
MNNQIQLALREMAKSPNGGHATTAAMLGLTLSALENRLYQIKGQALSIEQAMIMQRMTERTNFAEAVARESGGVFVKLPELDAAALLGLDITEDFLHTFRDVGLLWDEWREMTEDGKLESEESARFWRRVHLSVCRLLGIAVQSDRIFGAEHEEN